MEPRINLVTLGVRDLARSVDFYTNGLGFRPAKGSNPDITFLQMGGVVLALFGRRALAHDIGVEARGTGFPGFSLSINLRSRAEVDAAVAQAKKAGARVLKEPQEVFWGGYSGYFADPDGFAWEVAHNPFWELDAEGLVRLEPA